MARSVAWRHTISDAASWHQDQALSATIYILRETGPTGFLLKEEGEPKKVKVFLGDPHSCTCPVFKKERDLCKHICWVLLKKFRVPRQNPITFQLGLVEREINQILRGINVQSRQGGLASRNRYAQNNQSSRSSAAAPDRTDGRDLLVQREITEDDVCPICQDELLNAREPVTYCRYGCAKSIHIRCMKVWAEHQRSVGETLIRCPLCREDFGQLEQLQAEYRNASLQKTRSERLDVHTGICCQHCHKSPIQGKCYRCTECFDYCICHACYVTNIHTEHSFKFRQKMNQRWRPAQRGSGTAFPQAVMDDLLGREISDNDYDVLLQLDSDSANQPSNIPEKVIKSFPTETVRQGSLLLNPGVQCRVCLRGYSMGQMLRRLPCRHKFHATCIDSWLLHQHPTCPVDGSVVWTPTSSNQTTDSARRGKQSTNQSTGTEDVLDIGIGGTAVKLKRSSDAVSKGRLRGRPRIVELTPSDEIQQLTADFALTGLGIESRGQNNQSSPSEQQRVQSLIRRHSGRSRILHGDKDCVTGIGATERTNHATHVPAVNNVRRRPLHHAREGNLSTDDETSSQGNQMEASVLTNRTGNFSQTDQRLNDSVQLQYVLRGSDSNRNSWVPVPTRLETLILPGSPEANVSSKPLRTKGAIGRKPPVPSRPLVDCSSAPSIPPRVMMTPIGNSRHSNSAPSLRNRNIPLEAEGSFSGVTLLPTGCQLTRNAKSTPVSRARTTSQDSRSRLNLPDINKQQLLDSLFVDASCHSSHSASNTRCTGGQGSSPLRSRVSQALDKNRPVKPDRAFTDGILGNALNSEVT